MDITPVKTPKFIQKAFAYHTWHIPSGEKVIYLTFDDGPTPEITDWTLNTLEAFKAKATFFCIGDNIQKHPNLFKLILEKGHSVGNHTHNHLKGWKTDTQTYIDNTLKAQEIINHNSSDYSKTDQSVLTNKLLFRPPYGKLKPKQSLALHKLNYKTIMWSILSKDWDINISKEDCAKKVISKTQTGDIIVFHDSVKASRNMKYTLPKVLDYFSKKGFKFKRILAQDL